MLSWAYQKVMGSPLVYNTIRPFFLGGLDLSPFYARLGSGDDSTILDVGCGTGNALEYLTSFQSYVGYDTDPIAILSAQRDYGAPNVTFCAKECTEADVLRIRPSIVVLCGVLHHLPDEYAVSLMRALAQAPQFTRLCTLDITYLKGAQHWVSNILASLDRGTFCRRPEAYIELAKSAGLQVREHTLLWNSQRRHIARYHVMTLERINP
jgi:SAM-dependent methyltransferase